MTKAERWAKRVGPMLYVGLADVQVPDQAVDLDSGVILSPASSRLMRPFILTSGWGEPETSFGGSRIHSENPGYDIVGQVAVPMALVNDSGLHVDGTAWLFASLLRLASTPRLRTPVVSTGSFDGQVLSTGVQSVPLEREIIPDRLDLAPDAPASLSPANLDWVRAHWSKCLDLVRRDSAFGLLLRAVDGATFVGDASLALVMMWGALENIFSPARVELKFRVSGNISCFLEPPGASRVTVQRASEREALRRPLGGGAWQAARRLGARRADLWAGMPGDHEDPGDRQGAERQRPGGDAVGRPLMIRRAITSYDWFKWS